jgi:hypothetical protein
MVFYLRTTLLWGINRVKITNNLLHSDFGDKSRLPLKGLTLLAILKQLPKISLLQLQMSAALELYP